MRSYHVHDICHLVIPIELFDKIVFYLAGTVEMVFAQYILFFQAFGWESVHLAVSII